MRTLSSRFCYWLGSAYSKTFYSKLADDDCQSESTGVLECQSILFVATFDCQSPVCYALPS